MHSDLVRRTDTIHVLHVDDDPDIADLAATFLEREEERFSVETATSATMGFDRLAESGFDCIISDFDMPGQNGIDFLKAVRETYPDLPFILYTGKGSEEVASEAISAGVTDYLQKTAGTDQYTLLANRVRNAVEGYRAEQTRHRHLEAIESAQEGISILDENGEFIYVNEAYATLYGYLPEEMVGEHWDLIYPADDVAFVHDVILSTVAEDGYWHGETTGLHADGTTFPEDHVVSQTAHGELVCTVRDLSDRREREGELERYKRVLDTLPDSVSLFDENLTCTYVNQTFVEKSGIPRDDYIGAQIESLLKYLPENQGKEWIAIMERLAAGEQTHARKVLRIETGTDVIYIDSRGSCIESETGDLIGVVNVLRDVTERIEAQHELERQIEQLDEFAGVVSHDIRNPLSVAEGRLELAQQECDCDHLNEIGTALDRIGHITDEVLWLAQKGRDVGSMDAVKIQDAIAAAWKMVADCADEAELHYDNSDRSRTTVIANKAMFDRLWENLLQNAIKHGGDDVSVMVGTTADGFYIEDDGPGIPKEQREDVLSAGYSTHRDGTGFGLSIVKKVTENHGWDIHVSEGASGGARFEITGVEFVPG